MTHEGLIRAKVLADFTGYDRVEPTKGGHFLFTGPRFNFGDPARLRFPKDPRLFRKREMGSLWEELVALVNECPEKAKSERLLDVLSRTGPFCDDAGDCKRPEWWSASSCAGPTEPEVAVWAAVNWFADLVRVFEAGLMPYPKELRKLFGPPRTSPEPFVVVLSRELCSCKDNPARVCLLPGGCERREPQCWSTDEPWPWVLRWDPWPNEYRPGHYRYYTPQTLPEYRRAALEVVMDELARFLKKVPLVPVKPRWEEEKVAHEWAFQATSPLQYAVVTWYLEKVASLSFKTCPECHSPFTGARFNQDYCSTRCGDRVRQRRRRQRAGRMVGS